jgi:hypothetical protein
MAEGSLRTARGGGCRLPPASRPPLRGRAAVQPSSVGEPPDDRNPDKGPGEKKNSCHDCGVHAISSGGINSPQLKPDSVCAVPQPPKSYGPIEGHIAHSFSCVFECLGSCWRSRQVACRPGAGDGVRVTSNAYPCAIARREDTQTEACDLMAMSSAVYLKRLIAFEEQIHMKGWEATSFPVDRQNLPR